MNKYIRWWGIVAFFSLTALIAVFWLLFVDGMVRRLVERTGTAIAGAEVDVSSADISLSPLGIALTGIQITDPHVPTLNSLEIGRVAFSLDAISLLRRKVIIQEMTSDGLRFGTTRKTPGFIVHEEKTKSSESKPSSFKLPSFEIPDVKTALQKESLTSLKLIEDAQSDIQKARTEWQQRVSKLPYKDSIKSYRTRIDNLKISSRSSLKNLSASASDAVKIKQDIDQDLDRVKKAREAFHSDFSAAKGIVAKAEAAPSDDIRRIREKYGISSSGLQNLSQSLFGNKISFWLESGFRWYRRLEPLFSRAVNKDAVTVSKPLRGKGVDVKFPDRMPLPDFLIRTVKVSAQPQSGTFSGKILNITSDQNTIGSPLTFEFKGAGMKDVDSLSLSGSIDHIRPAKYVDSIFFQADNYRTGDLVLSENKDLPISLHDGFMSMSLTGQSTPDGLSAVFSSTFKSVRISTGTNGDKNIVLTSLKNALSRISSFTLSATITGMPGNYEVRISSDLDTVFKEALGRVLQEQSADFEKRLKTAIHEKTDDKIKSLRESLTGLNALGGNINTLQNQLNSLLLEVTKIHDGKVMLPF